MSRITVRCRAKINTLLRVLERREDGFHELDTEFRSLELHDRLTCEPASDGFMLRVAGAPPEQVPVDDNLVIRAARALQREVGAGCLPGASFVLEKRIPVAAGLGGGSSDAAGALVGLVELLEIPAETDLLERVALEIGSDVPYFLHGGRQRGRGRGEVLEALPETADRPLLLVHPHEPLSTAEVYRLHAEERAGGAREGGLTTRKPETNFGSWWQQGEPVIHDDLWPAALKAAPGLSELKRRVEETLPEARVGLTGSGPTLFAWLPAGFPEARLVAAAESLAGADVDPIVTRTVGLAEYRTTRFEAPSG